MTESSGAEPVRWWCFDGAVEPIATAPPDPSSPLWEVAYDNDCERGKRATRRLVEAGADYAAVAVALKIGAADWSRRLGYAVHDDPRTHGGGLHVTAPGGHLATHLDYAVHPDGRHLRALNVIAFVHPEWRPEWGGRLYLADPLGNVVREFAPVPGRVVAFEVSDLSYHGVRPTTAAAAARVSLAVYYLCGLDAVRACDATRHTRRRAQFLPARGPNSQ